MPASVTSHWLGIAADIGEDQIRWMGQTGGAEMAASSAININVVRPAPLAHPLSAREPSGGRVTKHLEQIEQLKPS